MKIAYIVLAFKNPDQLGRLIRKLINKDSTFYLHIDKKSKFSDFKNATEDFFNGGMKKYSTARVLRPTASQPGPLPPNQVVAITAIAKKNQKGLPNGTCSASDNSSATATSAIANT